MISKLEIHNYGKFKSSRTEYRSTLSDNLKGAINIEHRIVKFQFEVLENENLNIQIFCGNNGSGKSSIIQFLYEYIRSDSENGDTSDIFSKGNVFDLNERKVFGPGYYVHKAMHIYNYETLLSHQPVKKGENTISNYLKNHYIRDSPYIKDSKKVEELFSFITLMGYNPQLSIGFNHKILDGRYCFAEDEINIDKLKAWIKEVLSKDNIGEIIELFPKSEIGIFVQRKFNEYIVSNTHFNDIHSVLKDKLIGNDIIGENSSYYRILLYLFCTGEFSSVTNRPDLRSISSFQKYFGKIKGKFDIQISGIGGSSDWEYEFGSLINDLNDLNKKNEYNQSIGTPIFIFQYIYTRHNTRLTWNDLSEGERNMLHYFRNIFNEIKQGVCNIILIDEPEQSLHPRREQEYIELLKKIIQGKLDIYNLGKQKSDIGYTTVQVFIATHSTFIPTDIDSKYIHKIYTRPISFTKKLDYITDEIYYKNNGLLFEPKEYDEIDTTGESKHVSKYTYKLNKRLDEEFPSSYGASQSEIDAYLFDLDTVSGAESSKLLEELVAWVEAGKRKHIRTSSKHPWFQNINSKQELIKKINTTFEKSNNIAAKYLLYKLNI